MALTNTTNWLASLVNSSKNQTFPTEGLQKEAEAIDYMATTLTALHRLMHDKNNPAAKREMYQMVEKSYYMLSGIKAVEKKEVEAEKAAAAVSEQKPPLLKRVKDLGALLETKTQELKKMRYDEFPQMLLVANKPGRTSDIEKMKPAEEAIEAKIKDFNEQAIVWNRRLRDMLERLEYRFKPKLVKDRVEIKPDTVKLINRDTGISREFIVDSYGKYNSRQEELEDKIRDFENTIISVENSFKNFQREIERSIDAYKYGGKAGNETLGKNGKGYGLPYNPNLKDTKFTAITPLKSAEEMKKEISERKAKREASSRSRPTPKKPAVKKQTPHKSLIEREAPELLTAPKPAAQTTGDKIFREKKQS